MFTPFTRIQSSIVFMDLLQITMTRKFAGEKIKVSVIPKTIFCFADLGGKSNPCCHESKTDTPRKGAKID